MSEEAVSLPMRVSVIHSLAGSLRVHVPMSVSGRQHDILVSVRDIPGFQSVRMNTWTDNVLVTYDSARTDESTILRILQFATLSRKPTAAAPQSLTSVTRLSPGSSRLPLEIGRWKVGERA